MNLYFKISLLLIISFFSSVNGISQNEDGKIRILFIFDGSNSMNSQWGNSSKITIAKRLMIKTIDSLKMLENVEIALRMYGHQTKISPGKQDCSDTKLEVPFANAKENYIKIINKIRALKPKGTTPIARSLEYSAEDFPDCENCKNIIILLTDGIEACDEDPCAVAIALKEKNIKLKPFVIGLGLDTSYISKFQCIGEFLSAENQDSFKSVLKFVINQALNNTTVQVNLNNLKNLPKETNVTMSFYNDKNDKLLYTYMHTLNRFQKPDTIALDPLYTYKLVVHTVPEVLVKGIKLIPGKHNIINADSPMGELKLKIQGSLNQYITFNSLVKTNKESSLINVHKMNTTKKYLVGNYDLEILTLPRIKFDSVKINQSQVTEIIIPSSGNVEVNKSYGPAALFLKKDGQNIWLYDFDDNMTIEKLNIQPGNYFISFRNIKSESTANTIIKEFRIDSRKNIKINL
jgi:Ca-activated chloride channel family protein